jgi:hypothetical protein
MNNISFFKALLMKELNEKDLPGNQEKIAGAAEPKDKITAADFAALRAKKDMKKEEFGIGAMIMNAMSPLEPEELEKFYNILKDEPAINKAKYKPDFVDALKKLVFWKGKDSEVGQAAYKIITMPSSGYRYGPDKIEQVFNYIKNKKGGAMNEGEGQDHEVSMAQNSLKSIISSASQLMNMLGQDEKDVPAWIQDHITNAENYINQASKNYHEYNEGSTGEYDMDELPDGTIEKSAGDAEDLDMALKSIMEAKSVSLKDFSKNLELYKKGDLIKSQLINSYNKLNAKDQDKAKELAKDLDVLPNPKKINEISLKSMMETVVKRKKAK